MTVGVSNPADGPRAARTRRPWTTAHSLTALLFILLAYDACLMPAQNDTWWQLRAGKEMWRSGRIMLTDQFTHTVAGASWPNHEWLSQVLFYAVFRVGGLPLLTLACAAAAVGAWLLVLSVTRGPWAFRIVLVAAGASMSRPTWTLRPQVLTLLLFALTFRFVSRKQVTWLPLLFVLWANLHGGVATGGLLMTAAVLAAAAADRQQLRRFALATLLCGLATAVTPLGVRLWLEIPQSLHRLRAYGVDEWRAPSLVRTEDLPFWLFAAGTAILVMRRRQSLLQFDRAFGVIATILLFGLSLSSYRNVPQFLICAVPTAALFVEGSSSFERLLRRPQRFALHASVLLASAVALSIAVVHAWREPAPELAWRPLPTETLQAIASCDGPLYNRYDEGGYIIWFLERRRVFMDSRQDPFPEELVREQIRVEQTGEYRQLFARFGIACVLTPAPSVLAARLAADGWLSRNVDSRWRVYEAGRR